MINQTENSQQTDVSTEEGPRATAIDADAFGRLQLENTELRAAASLSAAREQITSELAKAGARSPALMFDAAKSDLQFADDGSVLNAAAMVGKLKAKFPEQFGVDRPNTSVDAGAGRINRPSLTKEALAAMKPSEIAKLDWADVRNVLSS